MDERIIEKAIDYIKELFAAEQGSHDAGHTLRVWENALRIAEDEADCDLMIVSLASLLHDTDDPKLFHTEDDANARRFLADSGVPQETADRICEVIDSVSFSRNRGRTPKTLEGRIVQDADRLDAMGAVGIARTFAYGGEHGRTMSDSVSHFHEKLLLLKDLMNTETGRHLAEKRHAFLIAFLEELEEETETSRI